MKLNVPIGTLFALALVLSGAQGWAQEEEATPFLREALYELDYAGLQAWQDAYRSYIVPALAQMQEEGLISGFAASAHNAGGKYNFRFVTLYPDWATIQTGGRQLDGRIGEALEAPNIDLRPWHKGHVNRIWQVTDRVTEQGADPTAYLYIASFEVALSEMYDWKAFYRDVWAPALQEAMDAGHLRGWAVEEHPYGSQYNWQIVYQHPSWDSIDDTWDIVFEAFEADPDAYEKLLTGIRSHEDNIWETIQPES